MSDAKTKQGITLTLPAVSSAIGSSEDLTGNVIIRWEDRSFLISPFFVDKKSFHVLC